MFTLPLLGGVAHAAEETNGWPLFVKQSPRATGADGETWSGLGPFLFGQPLPAPHSNEAERAVGFRPLFFRTVSAKGETREAYGLYPLFSYRRMTDGYRWSVFSLINHYSTQAPEETVAHRGFDLWPFYFSRETGSPDTSYRAVLPIYGSVPNRFGQDRLSWVLFPLYAKWEKNEVTTTTAPWPFIKHLRGQGNAGFEVWPVAGYRHKPGAYREQFYLWPLIFKKETALWQVQPDVRQGFLPFYASAKNADYTSESFFWPFFGYVDRTAPYRYHEKHYLWPIWVQGRGDALYVNRWGPFYTHSVRKGVEKTWIGWPVWKHQTWVDGKLRHTRRQVLYFLYQDTEQRSVSNPTLPAARKTHVWPLLSFWTNGAGKRQVQALSPLEIFYPNNDVMRMNYTPLFAVYRYSQSAPDTARHSALWNFVTYRREQDEREFHLGPLFSRERRGSEKRYALGNGLLALERSAESGRWKFSVFDFKRRQDSRPNAASAP